MGHAYRDQTHNTIRLALKERWSLRIRCDCGYGAIWPPHLLAARFSRSLDVEIFEIERRLRCPSALFSCRPVVEVIGSGLCADASTPPP